MSVRRIATVAAGIGILVAGHFVGGFAGAAVTGLGLGVAIVGLGRRVPHLLRRRGADDTEVENWSEW